MAKVAKDGRLKKAHEGKERNYVSANDRVGKSAKRMSAKRPATGQLTLTKLVTVTVCFHERMCSSLYHLEYHQPTE